MGHLKPSLGSRLHTKCRTFHWDFFSQSHLLHLLCQIKVKKIYLNSIISKIFSGGLHSAENLNKFVRLRVGQIEIKTPGFIRMSILALARSGGNCYTPHDITAASHRTACHIISNNNLLHHHNIEHLWEAKPTHPATVSHTSNAAHQVASLLSYLSSQLDLVFIKKSKRHNVWQS